MKIIFWSIFGIGAWTTASSIYLWLRDRTGNSGRFKHWTEE